MRPRPSLRLSVGSSALAGAAVSLASLGCAGEPGPVGSGVDGLGEASGEIVGGGAAAGDPAVVALTVQGQPFCTGTLVSPFTVVAAAHCIHPEVVGFPVEMVSVFFGQQVGQGGTYIDVVDGQYHPAWSQSGAGDYDVAVLRLAQPAEVAPIPMISGSLGSGFLGETVRLVGFGVTGPEQGGGGLKRETTATVADLYENQFVFYEVGQGTCNGDSGGPAFASAGTEEVLVGIHSLSDCESFGVDERVDSHRDDFILPYIANDPVPTCATDGFCASGCPDVDLDCPCAADGFCPMACTNVASDPDCDPACAQNGDCVQGCPNPDPDCAASCSANGVCEEGCASDPDCDPCAAGGCGGSPTGGDDDDGGGDAVDSDGGCSVSDDPHPPSNVPGALSILALALGLIRRSQRTRG